MASESVLSRKYFDGVYIPVGLLILGTFIVKRELLPYAALVALVLGAWKVYDFRTSSPLFLQATAPAGEPNSCVKSRRRSSSQPCSRNLS